MAGAGAGVDDVDVEFVEESAGVLACAVVPEFDDEPAAGLEAVGLLLTMEAVAGEAKAFAATAEPPLQPQLQNTIVIRQA